MFLEEAVEGGAADGEQFCGFDLVAFAGLQSVGYTGGSEFAFAVVCGTFVGTDTGEDLRRQVLGLQDVASTFDEGVLNSVL